MPAIHHQNFNANFYECDAFGYLQNIAYLRWMQEAAFGASAAVGYDFARYDAIHHLWLVRETELEIFQPITYGETIEIRTFVMDFRRFRSRRAYEFINQQTGQKVAEATTDWVYVNAESLRPAKIPEEIQRSFFPEGPPEEARVRDRSSFPLRPSEKIVPFHRVVRWPEIDQMWHVNNAAYFQYLQEAAHASNRSIGWPVERIKDLGFRVALSNLRLEYRLPAVLNDELEILTWVSDLQETSMVRNFQLQRKRDQALLVQAKMTLHWISLATGKFQPFPRNYQQTLKNNDLL